MKINYIEWKNFNSFGSELQRIDFSNRGELNLITGANGNGKSTILEVIVFSLYGYVLGKKNKDLVNRINNNLFTKINFEINGKNITIERGINPNFLKVDINGNSNFSEIAGKNNIENFIEKEIIRVPINMFLNTIIINVDKFKSFLKMTPSDKREIIDSIFNLNFLNKMLELHRQNFNDFKKEIKNIEFKINFLKTEFKAKKNELKIKKEDILKSNKENILELNNKLNKILIEKEKLENELKLKNDEYENEFVNNFQNINNEIIKNKEKIKELLKKQNLLKNEEICPLCGSDLKNKEHNIIFELEEELKKINKNILKLNKILENSNKKLIEKKNEIENIKKNLLNLQLEENKINNLIKIENKKIENNDVLNIIHEDLKKLKENLKNEEIKLEEYNKRKNIYMQIESILDENGFKRVLMNNFIPALNKEILIFTKLLNLNYNIIINDKFEIEINHLWKKIEPRTLSTGEEKKINLIILFSIIKLLKLKFNGLNILFLDEIFVNLDENTQTILIDILRKIAMKINLNIFLINHSIFELADFDNIYHVEKINNFSRVIKK